MHRSLKHLRSIVLSRFYTHAKFDQHVICNRAIGTLKNLSLKYKTKLAKNSCLPVICIFQEKTDVWNYCKCLSKNGFDVFAGGLKELGGLNFVVVQFSSSFFQSDTPGLKLHIDQNA